MTDCAETTKIKRSAAYIPPKAGLRPQLKATGIKELVTYQDPCCPGDDVDGACGRRKYFRLNVHLGKPMCVTILGLEDFNFGLTLTQLFGTQSCRSRKPVGDVNLTAENCQLIINKPGFYELHDPDFDLWPEGAEVQTSELDVETAKLLCEHGKACSI